MFVGNSFGGVLYNMIPHTVAGTHAFLLVLIPHLSLSDIIFIELEAMQVPSTDPRDCRLTKIGFLPFEVAIMADHPHS